MIAKSGMLGLGIVVLCLYLMITSTVWGYASNPPDAKTGAPGETTCRDCHGSASGDGTLGLNGLPGSYNPGQTYTLTVTLQDPGQQRWGFELTVIDAAGNNSGQLVVTDADNTQLSNNPGDQRDYLKQTGFGTYEGVVSGPVTWGFNWVAPSSPVGPLTFYVVGNAANANSGTSGDFIYTMSAATSSGSEPTATPTGPPSSPTPSPTSAPGTPTDTPTPPPNPTATPTGPQPSATPTAVSDTPTPNPLCNNLRVELEMPSNRFEAGDLCYLTAFIDNNSGTSASGFPLFIILDVYGDYWCAPSWRHVSEGLDSYNLTFGPGDTAVDVLSPFTWPTGVGEADNIVFWGALTNPEITALCGDLDSWDFGWR